jgi:hypothetical protein
MANKKNRGGRARNRQASSSGTSARTPVRPLSSYAGHVNRTGLNILRGESSALPQAVTMGKTRRKPPTGIHGNVVHGPVPVTMGATQNMSKYRGRINRTGLNVAMGPSTSLSLRSYANSVNRTGLNVPMGPSSQNRAMAAAAKAGPRMGPKTKFGLAVGGAAAVGVLMNNRSGRPTDRGRQSTYRY